MVASNRRINLIDAQDDNYIDSLIKANPEDEMMIRKARAMITRQKSRKVINDYLCQEVKEEVSNSLLKDTNSLGKDEGIYTETTFRKQNTRHNSTLDEDHISQKVCTQLDGIKWQSIRAVLRKSHCHDRAIACLELSLMGMSYREIGEKNYIMVSAMTVQRDVKCALNVLRDDTTLGLVEILCEVFCLSRSVVLDIIKI